MTARHHSKSIIGKVVFTTRPGTNERAIIQPARITSTCLSEIGLPPPPPPTSRATDLTSFSGMHAARHQIRSNSGNQIRLRIEHRAEDKSPPVAHALAEPVVFHASCPCRLLYPRERPALRHLPPAERYPTALRTIEATHLSVDDPALSAGCGRRPAGPTPCGRLHPVGNPRNAAAESKNRQAIPSPIAARHAQSSLQCAVTQAPTLPSDTIWKEPISLVQDTCVPPNNS